MKRANIQGRFNKYHMRLVCCLVAVISVLIVSGCSKPPCAAYAGPKRDLCLLRHHGIPIMRVGQTVKIVLPSDRLFENDTSVIQESFKPYLVLVANFIRSFSTITVKVAAYSNTLPPKVKTKSGSIDEVMTRAQAQAVLRYLTRHDIDARLLYAVGENGKNPIAWTGTPIDRSLNRRVEITFRYYENNTAWY